MLQRELTLAKTKIASLDNSLKQTQESNYILSQRIILFENREQKRLISTPPLPQQVPPSPPNLQPSASCCTSTICVADELAHVRLFLDELQGNVSLLLRASPHCSPIVPPVNPPQFILPGPTTPPPPQTLQSQSPLPPPPALAFL